eukprot:gene5245-6527_t
MYSRRQAPPQKPPPSQRRAPPPPPRGRRKQQEEEEEEEDDYEDDDEVEDEEEEEEEDYEDESPKRKRKQTTTTTTTTTTTASQKRQKEIVVDTSNLSQDEIHKLIGDFVRYILFCDRKRLPITKTEINAKVLAKFKDRHLMKAVYDRGTEKLKEIFGYDLIEIKKKTSVQYMLKNTIDTNLIDTLSKIDPIVDKEIESDQKSKAFLTIILGIMVLENQFIESDELYIKLAKLGFEEGKHHNVFGEWEKLIDRFVKELYLVKKKSEKIRENGKIIFEYRFGPRALMETSKRSVLGIISEVYGGNAGEIDPILLKSIELDEMEEEENEEVPETQPTLSQRSQRGR